MTTNGRVKAVCMLSGGLDSTLAAKIAMDLGVEIETINFVTAFCTCTPKSTGCSAAISAARRLGLPVRVVEMTEEFLKIIKHPPHGYGTYLNPCIDCRILMFRRARKYMCEIGASFIVTGEVLGERPMSQRKDTMRIIERESETEGLILRPLSARLLPPSIPELEGWVDRSKLLGVSGRSRKPQINLASSLGIYDYPCPAGGCRLTDPGFAGRMKDLFDHSTDINTQDIILMRYGRHFRLSPEAKAIVGRNKDENARMQSLAGAEDFVIEPSIVRGPLTLVIGESADRDLRLACSITAAYIDSGRKGAGVDFNAGTDSTTTRQIEAHALSRGELENLMVHPLPKGWRRLSNAV